jgi:hypothetical protein
MEQANRRHLENTRVVQKNLVYVIGLNPKYANEEVKQSKFQALDGLSNIDSSSRHTNLYYSYRQSCRAISLDSMEKFLKLSLTNAHHLRRSLRDMALLLYLVWVFMLHMRVRRMLRVL